MGQGVSLLLSIAFMRMHMQASWPMGFLRDPPVSGIPRPSHIRSTWITDVCYRVQLLSGFWGDLTSELHSYIMSALPRPQPPPQPPPTFRFFSLDLLYFMYMECFDCMYVYAPCVPAAHEGQIRVPGPLKLELQMVPKAEPQFSGRATCALNPWAISSAPPPTP